MGGLASNLGVVSVLWVLPVCVLAAGAAVFALAARRLAAEVAALRPALAVVADLAIGARAARAELDVVRARAPKLGRARR